MLLDLCFNLTLLMAFISLRNGKMHLMFHKWQQTRHLFHHGENDDLEKGAKNYHFQTDPRRIFC